MYGVQSHKKYSLCIFIVWRKCLRIVVISENYSFHIAESDFFYQVYHYNNYYYYILKNCGTRVRWKKAEYLKVLKCT